MKNSDFDNKYYRAKERVEQIKKFYGSLTSYVVVISILAAINYWNNEWRHAWFLWAAFGWGIGLVFHAIKVFGLNSFFGRDWEERKIKEFMNDSENENRWK